MDEVNSILYYKQEIEKLREELTEKGEEIEGHVKQKQELITKLTENETQNKLLFKSMNKLQCQIKDSQITGEYNSNSGEEDEQHQHGNFLTKNNSIK
jgi:hypothetical protein